MQRFWSLKLRKFYEAIRFSALYSQLRTQFIQMKKGPNNIFCLKLGR